MPVGSHKDAFKAHQAVKKLAKAPRAELAKFAADIIMDFVKNQRQVMADSNVPETLPIDDFEYDEEKLMKALEQVESLCGKCDDSHVDSCFVNQARRALIAAKTKIDLGYKFDGRKTLQELLAEAEAKRAEQEQAASNKGEKPEKDTQGSKDVESQDSAVDSEQIEKLKEELEEYKEKDVFRATLIDEIVRTISSVTEGNYAAEMPVHDDEQLGKLAEAFNIMLKAIEKNMSELDNIVAARTAELKQIMQSIPIGLLTVDEQGRINPEYSKVTEAILGTENLRGRNFLDTIGITKRREEDRKMMESFFDVIRLGTLSNEDLAGLNPFPELEFVYPRNGETHFLTTNFYLLSGAKTETASPNILVLLEDITEQKEMEAKIKKAQEENTELRAIAEDPDLFKDFLQESHNIYKNACQTLKDMSVKLKEAFAQQKDISFCIPMIHEIFRGVHTIKGASGSFSLKKLTEATDTLESKLSMARDNTLIVTDEFLKEVSDGMEIMKKALDEVTELAKKIIGEDIRDTSEITLKIPHSKLKNIEDIIKKAKEDSSYFDKLISEFHMLQTVPAEKALAKSIRAVPGLIERLNKNINFVVDGKDEPVYCEMLRPLNNALIHILRNAIDHGIEPEEERIAKGKQPQGMLRLLVKSSFADVVITISDDGKGLNPAVLKQVALKKGIINDEEAEVMSDEEAKYLIFKPGFSTAETISDVSGRGVGMDAVWQFVTKNLNGKIELSSEIDKGTTFTLSIPQFIG